MPNAPHSPDDEKAGLTAYAGRWVARLWGRIVGQGGTPEQAQGAAKSARHKENPHIDYVPTKSPLNFSPILGQVRESLPEKSVVYLVGGAVRDALLNIEAHDLDFSLPKNAIKAARRVANALKGAFYVMDEEHETGRVVLVGIDGERTILDFTAMVGPTLEDDLRGRDFTINAMAVDVRNSQQLLDPLGGLNDLLNKVLRACSPSAFQDDPVRVFRAVRMALSYQLRMEDNTRSWLKSAVPELPSVSIERIRDELFKILDGLHPAAAIRTLDVLGALDHPLPELEYLKGVSQSKIHTGDAWEHTLHTLQGLDTILGLLDKAYVHDNEAGGNIASGMISGGLGRFRNQLTEHLETPLTTERSSRSLLFLAALYHDIAKPQTHQVDEDGRVHFPGHEEAGAGVAAKRAAALRLSKVEVDRLKTIVRYHKGPWNFAKVGTSPSRRDIYRFFRDTGPAGVDICLLDIADILAIYTPTDLQDALPRHLDVVRSLLEAYWDQHDEIISPPSLLDGNDLMKALKLRPGPRIGELLEAIREAQALGEVKTKAEAIQFGRGKMENPKK
jgi:putative nucleotidyltransferase with HDIG domain